MKKKSNKQLMIFSAIMMIFVVDAHAWTSLSLMTRYMTYNMFIMPAFVFVSGYFFSFDEEMSVTAFVKKKIKKMIEPYYVWWFLYALFLLILKFCFSISIGEGVSLDSLILGPWKGGEGQIFTAPGWFVCCLFLIQLVYCILRKISMKFQFWNDWIVLVVLAVATIFATYHVTNNEVNHNYCNVYRVLLLLWFYHLGVVFRQYIEKAFERTSGTLICTISLVFMAFLNQFTWSKGFSYGVDFRFNTLSWSLGGMEQFGLGSGIYLIVVGTIGIIFWLKISQILIPVLGNNFFCNFISNHTFEIMLNHILFMWLFNLLLVKVNAFKELTNFDVTNAITNPMYRWCDSKWCNLMYLICGMVGAMIMAWISDKVKDAWKNWVEKVECVRC